jgi:hypothetical protein
LTAPLLMTMPGADKPLGDVFSKDGVGRSMRK